MSLTAEDKQWIAESVQKDVNPPKQELNALKDEIRARARHTEELILEFSQSLSREIHASRDEIRTRFESQAARLDRHAALWQTGRRWSGKMDESAEKIDAAIETKDRQIAELNDQLRDIRGQLKKLTGGNGHPQG